VEFEVSRKYRFLQAFTRNYRFCMNLPIFAGNYLFLQAFTRHFFKKYDQFSKLLKSQNATQSKQHGAI